MDNLSSLACKDAKRPSSTSPSNLLAPNGSIVYQRSTLDIVVPTLSCPTSHAETPAISFAMLRDSEAILSTCSDT